MSLVPVYLSYENHCLGQAPRNVPGEALHQGQDWGLVKYRENSLPVTQVILRICRYPQGSVDGGREKGRKGGYKG